MKSIIKTVLDSDWASLKTDVEKRAAEMVMGRINEKKIEVLAKMNGIEVDKMKEILDVTK